MSDDTRVDPLTGTTVIVVPARENRPNLPTAGCPFCIGGIEAPEPYDVKAFTNRWPSLSDGRAEVVLFSPDHDASLGSMSIPQITKVVELWTQRTGDLAAREDVGYVLIFENRGAQVGATIPHPHGQIYAYQDVPAVPRSELDLAASRGSCTLCEPITHDQLVAQAGTWRAWVPSASGHPYGMVLAPSSHVGSLDELDANMRHDLSTLMQQVFLGLDRHFGEATPYMWWMHQRPCDGASWPLAHLHIEIVPHLRAPGVSRFVAAAELGSGTLINSVDPLHAAHALRKACARGALS